MDENVTELDIGKSEKYKIMAIWDSAVFAKELEGHLSAFSYLVVKKSYSKEENT